VTPTAYFLVSITVTVAFTAPTLTAVETATLTYTEGTAGNKLTLTATGALTANSATGVSEVRLMVTTGYTAADVARLNNVDTTVASKTATAGTTTYEGATAASLSITRSSGVFTFAEAQTLLRGFQYWADVSVPDAGTKSFVLYVYATAASSVNNRALTASRVLVVTRVPSTPVVSPSPLALVQPSSVSFAIQASALDTANETTQFRVSSFVNGSLFLSPAFDAVSSSSFVTLTQAAAMVFVPTAAAVGSGGFSVEATNDAKSMLTA
jgi:hypothetical protein